MKKILILILSIVFISCAAYKKDIDLSLDIPTPTTDSWESIAINTTDKSHISNDWWKIFGDTKLDSVMEIFLTNNYDLKLAYSSLEASKALSKINGSDIFPTISLSLLDGNALGIGSSIPSEMYGLNLSSSWEVDIWGKLLSKRFSSKKEYQSQVNEYEYLTFSIISQGIKIYFNLGFINDRKHE